MQDWLDDRADAVMVTSEVLRVVRRGNHTDQGGRVDSGRLGAARGRARRGPRHRRRALARRRRPELLGEAGDLPTPTVRTLDAVHLASALSWPPDAVQFVTYDRRLARTAEEIGMNPVSPS